MKRLIILQLAACMLLTNFCGLTFADDITGVGNNKNSIQIIVDSKILNLKTHPLYKDSVLLVPVKKLMENLGSFIVWNDTKNQYEGKRKGIEFSIPLNKKTAVFDSVEIELNIETQLIDNVIMMDSYFVECLYGISTKRSEKTFEITIDKDKDIEYEEWSWEKVKSTLPEGEVEVSPVHFIENNWLSGSNFATAKIVDVVGMPFEKAVELSTQKQPVNTFDVKISAAPVGDIRRGDVAVLTFYAKKTYSTHESGNAFTEAVVEQNFGGWGKVLMQPIALTDEWQHFALPVYDTTKDLQVSKYELNFRGGYKPQTILIGDVNLVNYKGDVPVSVVSPDAVLTSYKGMEEDALWRKEAYRRIDKHRKTDMQISVVDKKGNPIPNAKVSAHMVRNEFMFGSAGDEWLFNTRGVGALYAENFKKYFNTITPESSMKWPYIVKNNGVVPAMIANWAIDNNMYLRGHNLIWDSKSGLPSEITVHLDTLTEEEIQAKIIAHIVEMVKLFGDSVDQWDLLNEPGFNNLLRTKYGYEFAAEWFKAAKQALDGKDVKLYVNEMEITGNVKSETKNVERLIEIVEGLKKYGAHIDGIGIESHCVNPVYPQDFYNQLNQISQHTDEIAITEYDLQYKDRDIAAKFLRDVMIASFSHPKCTGFIMWGFTDKYHWFNNAPLLDSSFNKKQAADVYVKTIGEFTTSESGQTNDEGSFGFRGFRGDYSVTIEVDGIISEVKCTLKKDSPNIVKAVYDGEKLMLSTTNSPKVKEKVNIQKFHNERDNYQKLDWD